MDMGVDSILGVRIVNAVNDILGINLGATVLFDYPTVDKLTGFIQENFGRNIRPVVVGAAKLSASELFAAPSSTGRDTLHECAHALETDSGIIDLLRRLERRELDVDEVNTYLEVKGK